MIDDVSCGLKLELLKKLTINYPNQKHWEKKTEEEDSFLNLFWGVCCLYFKKKKAK